MVEGQTSACDFLRRRSVSRCPWPLVAVAARHPVVGVAPRVFGAAMACCSLWLQAAAAVQTRLAPMLARPVAVGARHSRIRCMLVP